MHSRKHAEAEHEGGRMQNSLFLNPSIFMRRQIIIILIIVVISSTTHIIFSDTFKESIQERILDAHRRRPLSLPHQTQIIQHTALPHQLEFRIAIEGQAEARPEDGVETHGLCARCGVERSDAAPEVEEAEGGVLEVVGRNVGQRHLHFERGAGDGEKEDSQEQFDAADGGEALVDELEVVAKDRRADERTQRDDGEDEMEVRLEGNVELAGEPENRDESASALAGVER